MKSEILKLDAPYNVIYAGGFVGRHIATLLTWSEDEDGEFVDTVSYPIIDRGEEYPAGKLVMENLDDCRVLCPPGGTNLMWVAKIIEYDYQQLEPAGPENILERMKLLGCRIAMPTRKNVETGEEVPRLDYKATLEVWCVDKDWDDDENSIYRVHSNRCEGFYFQSEGTPKEIYNDLSFQLSTYLGCFHEDVYSIRFQTNDGQLTQVTNKLNASQRIEGFEDEDDTF